ncbi:MAG: Vitamin K epoxide reductase [Gordonia sp.]|nr:Vitamin K epoxide reductase [Gordonia sp. (in: high G+C Gram-positive bacteria)]
MAAVLDSETPDSGAPPDLDAPVLFPKLLPWLLGICGTIGLIASFTLTVEKFELATDPDYVPSCSINPVVNCGSIMDTSQAAVFGFPNSLLGIAGFAALLAVAVMMGRTPQRFVLIGLQVGLTAALVFVHWLIFQSFYRIGALCPYCMAVWVAVVLAFWYVSLRTADEFATTERSRRVVDRLVSIHSVVPVLWVLVVIALITERFWYYWSTLL